MYIVSAILAVRKVKQSRYRVLLEEPGTDCVEHVEAVAQDSFVAYRTE